MIFPDELFFILANNPELPPCVSVPHPDVGLPGIQQPWYHNDAGLPSPIAAWYPADSGLLGIQHLFHLQILNYRFNALNLFYATLTFNAININT